MPAQRVFPDHLREQEVSDQDQIDWLCHAPLDRIGVATQGETRKFWEATEVAEVANWVSRHGSEFVPVEVETAEGAWTKALACPDIETCLAAPTPPTSRLRILSRFDPAIRDWLRLKRLFGFD
jgi:uncharacterized protein YcaQ